MVDTSQLARLDNFDGSRDCFACGPENDAGLHMEFHTDGQRLYSFVTVARHHCGWSRVLHGGIVTTLMDETMSWSAHHLLKKLILTKAITVEFFKPLYVESPLRVEGRVDRINSEREAVMAAEVYNDAGHRCAAATGVFATLTPKLARRMRVIDEKVVDAFERHFFPA